MAPNLRALYTARIRWQGEFGGIGGGGVDFGWVRVYAHCKPFKLLPST